MISNRSRAISILFQSDALPVGARKGLAPKIGPKKGKGIFSEKSFLPTAKILLKQNSGSWNLSKFYELI